MQLQLFGGLALVLQAITAHAYSHDARVHSVFRRNAGPDSKHGHSDDPSVYETQFDNVTWDNDNWRLRTTSLDQGHFQSRGSIANGYIGINVASAGPFFEIDDPVVINGWPLFSSRQTFATISGFWDYQPETNGTNFGWMNQYGGESVISGVPHWSGLLLDLGNGNVLDATVDNGTISNYSSTFDFKGGVLTWEYTWTPKPSGGSFKIKYQLLAHKLYVNQALVQLEVTPSINTNATIVNVIDGYSAVRTDFVESGADGKAIFTSVRPNGINNVTAYIYATLSGTSELDAATLTVATDNKYVHTNASSIAQTASVSFQAGKTTKITKFVGIASSDAFSNPKDVAKNASTTALQTGYEKSLKSHIGEWAAVFPDDSVDSFALPGNGSLPSDIIIIKSQVTAITNPYYLLQNTISKNAEKNVNGAPVNQNSVAVGGLTSDSYGGLIFWDADMWMQPGIVAAFPESAQTFSNYRIAKYGQALANTDTAYQTSKNRTDFSADAALYPWTSARFGNCTGTGPCFDYQYHLNGDIGLELINSWVATGDTQNFKEKMFPIYNSIATVYADLLERNGSSWTLTNMTDPDEYANHVDAGGYTMPLIAQTLQYANVFRKFFGLEPNETWNELARDILVPKDPRTDITMEYTTMNGSTSVKQADVVLDTFPLRYTQDYTPEDALRDLDFYAGLQSPDGPGMTYAIFSIVANEVSPSGCSAYTYGQNSYEPYIRPPFFQFSEQLIDNSTLNGGTNPAFPFLTGNGGANQVVLFGYLGLRLLPDFMLHVDPNLPPQIPHLRYRTFYWRGWPITAESNYTHTTLARAASQPLDTADAQFANATIPVHVGSETNGTVFQLPPTGKLTITNRQIGSMKTVAGNIAQCQPAASAQLYEPGQFPIAAVDGAASTKWQPSNASTVAALTVTLADQAPGVVSGFFFDWAQNPPENVSIIFHNVSLSSPTTTTQNSTGVEVVTVIPNVTVSNPYDAQTTDLDVIALPQGNTTNVTLAAPVGRPRFATLLISGNQALGEAERQAKNGTGATVAEWAILDNTDAHAGSTERRLRLRGIGVDEPAAVRERSGQRRAPGSYARYMKRDWNLPR